MARISKAGAGPRLQRFRAAGSFLVSFQFLFAATLALAAAGLAAPAGAQPLVKSAVQVDAGNTKPAGENFGYSLAYNCSSTSGPCLNAEVDDLLPPQVAYVSNATTSDVAAVNVTPNYMGSGRTRVQFVMNTPLTAGNSGDLLVTVKFPDGSTPNGTTATNTADGVNLGSTPGTFTTPPVTVTATAALDVALSKTLLTSPANLDRPVSYRLRIAVNSDGGDLELTAVGPVTDTLPTGVVFNSASPAADCEPGCDGTTPASLTWTSPCSLPLGSGSNCDIQVNVTYPSATFTSGTSVTNSFTATGTPLGGTPTSLGTGQVTHPVTTFVANPNAGLSKNVNGGSPNPPTLNQTFSYAIAPSNSGNVPLDTMVVTDTLPVQFQLASVTTGAYNNLSPFAAGVGVRVSYEKNTALGTFTLWGSSPNVTTNTTLTAPPPGLGAGEYVTRIKWEFGQAAVGMSPSTNPTITGQIVNPDNAGNPVAFGNSVQNCSALTAVYTAGPTNVNKSSCNTFTLSGPFVQLNPAKDNLSGGGPFNPGQTVSFRLRVRSAAQSSDPAPLEDIVAVDELPVDLIFGSWTFDDQGTGLPAPQNFEQIPNFQGSGRTLLRWHWNAGSGSLGVNQQVWINITTTIRSGAAFGPLSNTMDLSFNGPGLGFRCSGSSTTDTQDLNNNGSTTDTLCTASGSITVASDAQLVSSKTVRGLCDADYTATSSGTLAGGAIQYKLHVQNAGTIPVQNMVMVDILPFVGDTGVRDTSPRGSQWTPLLAAPISPPAGTAVYYSTSGNPCRGEVGGPTTACDPPNWTTVPPSPITDVKSFKVEFGSRVIGAFDVVEFTFSLTAPGNVPAGQTAYNSFAYQADRADGLGQLAAEPQKVGIAPGACTGAALGDFVWVDVNKDGIQNDGATGRNGLYTRLFSPGADGVPGTPDDVLLSTTITANGPDNAPGWYMFPDLAPGSYFVCVTPPPTFVFTTPNQGTAGSNSVANTTTGCSPLVTLTAGQVDLNVDFGLVATQLASLGDYVWFDRNSDGTQNESPWDGVNGVTVKLWADNGNGTPEPGTGDALVATTVTADDVYGHPGYYRFDNLVPGLSYYVQFVKPASATAFTVQHAGGDTTTDSDADTTTGVTQMVVLAPGEYNSTLDAGLIVATGPLALGNQVWLDSNNNGIFEPQNGETGINNVQLDLYVDANNDGLPGIDEYAGTTFTSTVSGFDGRYGFSNLAAGNYIVVVHPSSFAGSGALAGLGTSTGNDPAPSPNDDVDGDDNGTNIGALIGTHPVTLTAGGEPTSEDGNANTNLTVDFGFFPTAAANLPHYDYGDAPDVGATTGVGSYNTTALHNGPYHLLVPGGPFLGACVDADDGTNQDPLAKADDRASSGFTLGTCGPNGDEDGVAFTGPFIPGGTASFTVTAGGPVPCVLNAWVDWNRDGTFGDSAGEQIATDVTVAPGSPVTLTPAVPAGAVPGVTYARFRCSTATGLGPTGPAPDGEVEDYSLSVIGYDYGDAPASYGTSGAGAARHKVDPLAAPLMLGRCVDTEPDGQPNATATGDDDSTGTNRIGTCFNDEDGVTFSTPLTACTTATVNVFVTGNGGKLDAWLDFAKTGSFTSAGAQIFTNQPVVAGNNVLTFAVPCNTGGGQSYARFRLSSAGGLPPTGDANDGEVEDYLVVLGQVDFGDAPDTYGTTLAHGGPYHRITTGFSLGASETAEADGQPSVGANADGGDDGVTIPAGGFTACSTVSLPITLTNTAGIATPKLDAWIDWDGDGTFDDPRDRIATGFALTAGANNLTVNVPCDAKTKTTYARFRLSSTGVAGPGGMAADGEVEDYVTTTQGLDFGDAPHPYPTLLADNGARHVVLVSNNPTLGNLVDTEPDGQPNPTATGDDTHGGANDEDGVVFAHTLIPGAPGTMQISAGATGGFVSCWIDFNHNGSWADAGDQVVTDLVLAAHATMSPTFTVPVGSPAGPTFSRCRISSQSGLGITGLAPDGEVEDHLLTIGSEAPQIGVAKNLVSIVRDPSDALAFDVTFSILVENMGNVPLTGVNVAEHLSTTFPAPVTFNVVSVTSPTLTVNNAFDGAGNANLLAGGNTLAIGASGTITLVVHVHSAGNPGPYSNSVTASGVSPATVTVTDVSQDGTNPDPDGDGNPTNNNTPTTFQLPVAIALVPTLGTWGLALLTLLVGAAAVWRLKRREGGRTV